MTTPAAAIEGPWSGGGRQNSSMSTGDLLCPLNFDSGRSVGKDAAMAEIRETHYLVVARRKSAASHSPALSPVFET
jgi:hypothetical protein